MDWQTGVGVTIFKNGDHRVCSNYCGITYSASRGKLMPGCWKGGSDRWLNFRFKTNSAESVPVVELWTSSLPSQDY